MFNQFLKETQEATKSSLFESAGDYYGGGPGMAPQGTSTGGQGSQSTFNPYASDDPKAKPSDNLTDEQIM